MVDIAAVTVAIVERDESGLASTPASAMGA